MTELVLFRIRSVITFSQSQVPKPHVPLTLLLSKRTLLLVPLPLPVISLRPFLLSVVFTEHNKLVLICDSKKSSTFSTNLQTVTHNVNCRILAALQLGPQLLW